MSRLKISLAVGCLVAAVMWGAAEFAFETGHFAAARTILWQSALLQASVDISERCKHRGMRSSSSDRRRVTGFVPALCALCDRF